MFVARLSRASVQNHLTIFLLQSSLQGDINIVLRTMNGYTDPNFPNPMGPNDASIIIYGYAS